MLGVVFTLPPVREEEVQWEAGGEETNRMFTQRSYHNVSDARASRTPHGWLIGAREATPFFVKDEDILALYATADLRLRLQDVPDRALLILQRAQRHDVRMKRFPSCIGAAYLRMGLVMRT